MNTWMLLPPIAFSIILLAAWLQYRGMALLRANESWPDRPGRLKAYACGEDVLKNRVQPDYSQFFPFAFFFTVMHVMALMVATVPAGAPTATLCAVWYLAGSAIGLFILFRR
jgi:NADH:ubiquinone oxidoreductase subunit 3 (subunit A)